MILKKKLTKAQKMLNKTYEQDKNASFSSASFASHGFYGKIWSLKYQKVARGGGEEHILGRKNI